MPAELKTGRFDGALRNFDRTIAAPPPQQPPTAQKARAPEVAPSGASVASRVRYGHSKGLSR
jgi:hypothetical protein